jgi:succinylglutamate desuccinylase
VTINHSRSARPRRGPHGADCAPWGGSAGRLAGLGATPDFHHGLLAVVSGAHGSEYASIVAVEQLITVVNAADVSGTLILLPIVNVPSFEQIVPPVNPVDGKNMNRFFV